MSYGTFTGLGHLSPAALTLDPAVRPLSVIDPDRHELLLLIGVQSNERNVSESLTDDPVDNTGKPAPYDPGAGNTSVYVQTSQSWELVEWNLTDNALLAKVRSGNIGLMGEIARYYDGLAGPKPRLNLINASYSSQGASDEGDAAGWNANLQGATKTYTRAVEGAVVDGTTSSYDLARKGDDFRDKTDCRARKNPGRFDRLFRVD